MALTALSALVLLPFAVDARELVASAQRIDSGPVEVIGLQLALGWPEQAARGSLRLQAARLEWPDAGYRLRDVVWQCELQRSTDPEPNWTCEGPVQARGLPPATLRLHRDAAGAMALTLSRARGRLQLAQDSGSAWTVQAQQMPVGWLQPLLQAVWPEARLTGGTLEADLRLADEVGAPGLAGTLSAIELGLDTEDGRIAAAGLGIGGSMKWRFGADRLAVETRLSLQAGELLVGPLYTELPASPVAVEIVGERGGDGRWQLPRLQWVDPGVLDVEGSAAIAASELQALQLRASMPDLATAHDRYLESLLGSFGGAGLTPAGAAAVDLSLADGAWTVQAKLDDVTVADERQRFALAGATGRLGWTGAAMPVASDLQWRAAALYGVGLGSARLLLQSVDGGLRLAGPLEVALLGGSLGIEQLAWRPAGEQGSAELDLALALDSLDLQALAMRLGWPPFTGELSGRIPAARYDDGVLSFEGGLQVGLFDGRVDVSALRLERPFGVAPQLQADVQLEQLDLQPLTAAFGFGEITGRLNGRIAALRLVDWTPVAFDAALRTADKVPGPKRISQRAVSDLTSIGGGGIAGGLQKQVLKLFDSFAYSAIGLRCRLHNEVCEMGGLEPAAQGYVIVDGAGLPRITVIGHQRRVDWPVLVARLKAATEGQPIRIE